MAEKVSAPRTYEDWPVIMIAGILLIGVFYLFKSNRISYAPQGYAPQGYAPTLVQSVPETTYTNEETWELSWGPDKLPSKITIHRNAVQK